MNIDWFTFVAQIINFLILVGLLRWLLYGPIIDAMQQREQKIADRWNTAEQKLSDANRQVALFERKNSEFDAQRDERMRDLHREAHEHRERLTRETRDDIELKRTLWHDALSREQSESADEIRQQLGELAIESARHTLVQLADADLEQLVARKFVEQIQQMDEATRDEIKALLQDGESSSPTLHSPAPRLRVLSAFELSEDSRTLLCDAIRQTLGYQGEVNFEQSRELICGLQLDAGGYSIEWNIDDFIRQIKLEFGHQLKRQR